MKKSNKKNIWVPGKPMTPKAREMLESGKGAMNADGRWTCLECNRSLSNEWTLEQHIQTVHGARTFSCDKCNERFKRRDHLLNHEKTIHKGLKPCKRCNVTFNNREELRQHKLKVHYKPLPDGTMPPIPRYLTQPIDDDSGVISPPIRSPPPQPQMQSQSYQIVTPNTHPVLQEVSQSSNGQNLLPPNAPITTTQQIVIQPLITDKTSEITQSFTQTITIPQIVQPNINVINPLSQSPQANLTPVSQNDMKNLRGRKWRRSFGSSGQEDEVYNEVLHDDAQTHCDVFGCDKQFNNNKDFNKHWQLIHEEHKCQLCKQLFSGSRSLKIHKLVHEPGKSGLNMKEDKNRNNLEGFKCWFCPGVFKEKGTLLEHVDAFHVGCVCLECGSCLLGSEQCGDHIADQHPPQKVLEEDQDRCHYQCSACFHVFSKRIEAERHFIEQHFVAENEKVFHCCPYCPDVFHSYVRLNDHIQWEHGLEEKDDNAVILKNRETQQFFQCEICEHFFQSESILEKHIIGHQVERVARYKVSPLGKSSPAKRKRKHSKKHKKKNEKREKRNSEVINLEDKSDKNFKNDFNAINDMDVDLEINEKIPTLDDTEISSIQVLPTEQNKIQTESECQIPESIKGSCNGQPTLLSSYVSSDDISILTSPCEINLRQDTAALASPEIEQAVASISGPIINEEHSPKNVCNEDHVNENNSILPITSGTLEIENAVNSILGEASDLSQMVPQENADMFDMENNSDSLTQQSVLADDQVSSIDTALLENSKTINGGLKEYHDTSDIQEIPKLRTTEMTVSSAINYDQQPKEKHNGSSSNGDHSMTEENVKAVDYIPQKQSETVFPENVSTIAQPLPNMNSTMHNGNVKTAEKIKLTDIIPIENQETESPENNQLLANNQSTASSQSTTDFDISDSQSSVTKDMLAKTTFLSNNINPQTSIHTVNASELETPSVVLNNGDLLNHR